MLKTVCSWILIALLTGCAGKSDNSLATTGQPDTILLNRNLRLYDSVYSIYDSARMASDSAFNILKKADLFLDTVINNAPGYCGIKDSLTRAKVLNAVWNKAADLNDMRNFTEAEKLLSQYLLCCDQAGLRFSSRQAYACKLIGDIYSRFGDYNLAVYHKRKSLEYYSTLGDIPNFSSEIIGISIPFREEGLYDSAIFYLRKGMAVKATEPKRLLSMFTELAKNYLEVHEIEMAEKALQDGLVYFGIWKNKKMEYDRLSEYKATEAVLLLSEKNYTAYQDALQESLYYLRLEYKRARTRDAGKLYNKLGDAYMLQNKKDSAIYCYNRALWNVCNTDTADIFSVPGKEQLYAENTIAESLDCKAKWMISCAGNSHPDKKKYLECAVKCFDASMDVEYKLMQHFSYDESKIAMLKESRDRSAKAINACYELYCTDKKEEHIETAFRFAERNKAFVLLESFKRNLAVSQLAHKDTMYEQMQQAELRYAGCEKQLIQLKNGNDTGLTSRAETDLALADEAIQKIKLRMRYTGNSFRQLLYNEDHVSLAGCQAMLSNNQSAMIEYFIADSASYCFLITKNKTPKITRLTDSLEKYVKSLLYFFGDKDEIIKNPIGYNTAAHKVYTALGLQETSNMTSLVIVPDNDLYFIPFDALVTGTSSSYNLSTYNYLVKNCNISNAYSATILLKQKEYSSSNTKAIVFAPLFNQNQRGLEPLPFSEAEYKSVSKYAGADVYTGSTATLRNFRKYAIDAGIIHIATHAAAAGIPRIEFYDSTFYLNEIYAMQLKANLVVLSGCETGIGKIEKSEGAISLARGFYYAGAHNVITSLWAVDDNSTSRIFENFYSSLAGGNYGEALYKAKLEYLQTGKSNDKYSPYYWAGIIYTGETNSVHSNKPYFIIWIIVLAALFLGLHKTRRQFKFNKPLN